jgi:hypothetical protein
VGRTFLPVRCNDHRPAAVNCWPSMNPPAITMTKAIIPMMSRRREMSTRHNKLVASGSSCRKWPKSRLLRKLTATRLNLLSLSERDRGWRAASPGKHWVRLVFDQPQSIKRWLHRRPTIQRDAMRVMRQLENRRGIALPLPTDRVRFRSCLPDLLQSRQFLCSVCPNVKVR